MENEEYLDFGEDDYQEAAIVRAPRGAHSVLPPTLQVEPIPSEALPALEIRDPKAPDSPQLDTGNRDPEKTNQQNGALPDEFTPLKARYAAVTAELADEKEARRADDVVCAAAEQTRSKTEELKPDAFARLREAVRQQEEWLESMREIKVELSEAEKTKNAARDEIEQAAIEDAIEVSRLEAAIAELREEGERKGRRITEPESSLLVQEIITVEGQIQVSKAERRADAGEAKVRGLEGMVRRVKEGGEENRRSLNEARERVRELERVVVEAEGKMAKLQSSREREEGEAGREQEGREEMEREREVEGQSFAERMEGVVREGKEERQKWGRQKTKLEAEIEGLRQQVAKVEEEVEEVEGVVEDVRRVVKSRLEGALREVQEGEVSERAECQVGQAEAVRMVKDASERVEEKERERREAQEGMLRERHGREAAERACQLARSEAADAELEVERIQRQVAALEETVAKNRYIANSHSSPPTPGETPPETTLSHPLPAPVVPVAEARRRDHMSLSSTGDKYVHRKEEPPPLPEGTQPAPHNEIFEACRDRTDGQRGGWWCPVPAPTEGEALSYDKNCNHAPFATKDSVRKHYHREHWDFGVWRKVPRRIRTFGLKTLYCPGACGCGTKTLELLDAHAITIAYDLHQSELSTHT